MKTIKAFIKSHPLLSYFGLVLAISWGGVLIVVGPYGIPATNKEQYERCTSVWLYLLGPIIGGVLGALLYDRTMAQTEGPG